MFGLEVSQEQHDEGTAAGGPCTSPKPHKETLHLLNEGRDLCPQLRSLAWWKIFTEEGLGERFPGGEGVGLRIL